MPSSGPSAPSHSPPSPASSSSSDPPPTNAKRKFDEIVASLGRLPDPNEKRKRSKRDSLETKSSSDKLLALPKFFARGVHPFLDLGLVLHYGALAHWPAPQPSGDAANAMPAPSAQELDEAKLYGDAFNKMIAIWPDSVDILREFYKDDAEWKPAHASRQGDTAGLKKKSIYALPPHLPFFNPPFGELSDKSDRGLKHPQIRLFLVPPPMAIILCSVEVPKATEGQEAMDGQDATDGEEATNGQHATDGEEATNGQDASQAIPQPTIEAENMRKGLLDGSITLTAAQYPCCFYPSLDFIYDPNNPQLGLFRSDLLLRACFPMFFQSQTDLVCRSYVIFGQRQIPLSRAPMMAPRRQGMQEPSARVKLRDDGSPTPAARQVTGLSFVRR
ncbi:hypothetical protein FB45DRAFT_1090960 [Roridomyces roridus]|uniref:Uncharacterized protein n=1 Tax=Roridomyces roridus TaxID=1738132 RepID=A0AAD7BIP9_9AGAR|nr:hypothetical protein FB45DRAFT_1090960 [Roridomyces roridus]